MIVEQGVGKLKGGMTKKSSKRWTRNRSLWLFNMVQQMFKLLKWCQNNSDSEEKEISAEPEKVEKRERRNVVQRMREKSRCHSGADRAGR